MNPLVDDGTNDLLTQENYLPPHNRYSLLGWHALQPCRSQTVLSNHVRYVHLVLPYFEVVLRQISALKGWMGERYIKGRYRQVADEEEAEELGHAEQAVDDLLSSSKKLFKQQIGKNNVTHGTYYLYCTLLPIVHQIGKVSIGCPFWL